MTSAPYSLLQHAPEGRIWSIWRDRPLWWSTSQYVSRACVQSTMSSCIGSSMKVIPQPRPRLTRSRSSNFANALSMGGKNFAEAVGVPASYPLCGRAETSCPPLKKEAPIAERTMPPQFGPRGPRQARIGVRDFRGHGGARQFERKSQCADPPNRARETDPEGHHRDDRQDAAGARLKWGQTRQTGCLQPLPVLVLSATSPACRLKDGRCGQSSL